MRVYVVWSKKNEWFEIYSLKPKWIQEEERWGGLGLLRIVSGSELPESVANEAKHWGNAVRCYAEIEVKYAFIG